jgi:hypothetical protein
VGGIRDGYNNPAMATTQAEKLGAAIRAREEATNKRRADECKAPPPPPYEPTPQVFRHPVDSQRQGAPASNPVPSTAGSTARAGAVLFAVLAVLYSYHPHANLVALGTYAAIAAAVGYVAGWLAHYVLVIAAKVLQVALTLALWGVGAYIVLSFLGFIH